MLFFLVILGAWMGWTEAVYGAGQVSESADPPDAHDWYAPLPEPPEYLRNTYEVTGTGDKADEYLRFWARSRR